MKLFTPLMLIVLCFGKTYAQTRPTLSLPKTQPKDSIALQGVIGSHVRKRKFPLKTVNNKRIDARTTRSFVTTTQNLKSQFIPDSIFNMINLKYLYVGGMDCDYGDTTTCWIIREIPKRIGNLKNLERLELPLNALQALPREICALQKLRTLNLTDNPGLSNIDHITTLTKLEQLSLFGCNLSKLPSDIVQLKKLKYLGLTGNNIDSKELERIRKALPGCEIVF